MIAGYRFKSAPLLTHMQNTTVVGPEHLQKLFEGKLKNITQAQALIKTLCKLIAHTKLTDELVGAFIQLGILERRTGSISHHGEKTQIHFPEGGLIQYHMKYTVYTLFAPKRKSYFHCRAVLTSGMKRNPAILEGSGAHIIASPAQRKRFDLR
ncbi:hypothetical protein KC345_g11664, partial [Hortaea werneckii]